MKRLILVFNNTLTYIKFVTQEKSIFLSETLKNIVCHFDRREEF